MSGYKDVYLVDYFLNPLNSGGPPDANLVRNLFQREEAAKKFVDFYGQTLLLHRYVAFFPSRLDLIQLFVTYFPQALQMEDAKGKLPFEVFITEVEHKPLKTLQYLVELCSKALWHENDCGQFPWHCACTVVSGWHVGCPRDSSLIIKTWIQGHVGAVRNPDDTGRFSLEQAPGVLRETVRNSSNKGQTQTTTTTNTPTTTRTTTRKSYTQTSKTAMDTRSVRTVRQSWQLLMFAVLLAPLLGAAAGPCYISSCNALVIGSTTTTASTTATKMTTTTSNNSNRISTKSLSSSSLLSSSYPRFTIGCRHCQEEDPQHEYEVVLQTSPLIGGPSWLPMHVRVVIVVGLLKQPKSNNHDNDDNNHDDNDSYGSKQRQLHAFDFVPLNATQPETIQRLITLQSTLGEIRYLVSNGAGVVDSCVGDHHHYLPDKDPAVVIRALDFCNTHYITKNTNLHLLYNNCWNFALQLTWHLLATGR